MTLLINTFRIKSCFYEFKCNTAIIKHYYYGEIPVEFDPDSWFSGSSPSGFRLSDWSNTQDVIKRSRERSQYGTNTMFTVKRLRFSFLLFSLCSFRLRSALVSSFSPSVSGLRSAPLKSFSCVFSAHLSCFCSSRCHSPSDGWFGCCSETSQNKRQLRYFYKLIVHRKILLCHNHVFESLLLVSLSPLAVTQINHCTRD